MSFKSKINFVSNAEFYRFNRWHSHFVPYLISKESVCIADEFYTEGVRTCAAGGFINTKTRKAIGFHFLDDKSFFNTYTKNTLNYIFKLINPDKCLLLGGKKLKTAPFSMEQFEYLKNFIGNKVEKLTIFEEHLFPVSETDMRYLVKDDTWNIHSLYKKKRFKEGVNSIVTPEELQLCFKNVVVSPDDELVFHGRDVRN